MCLALRCFRSTERRQRFSGISVLGIPVRLPYHGGDKRWWETGDHLRNHGTGLDYRHFAAHARSRGSVAAGLSPGGYVAGEEIASSTEFISSPVEKFRFYENFTITPGIRAVVERYGAAPISRLSETEEREESRCCTKTDRRLTSSAGNFVTRITLGFSAACRVSDWNGNCRNTCRSF